MTAHQLQRPALARLLDSEEARLPADTAVLEAIHETVHAVLASRSGPRFAPLAVMTADVIGLTRGLTDMAGLRRETDAAALAARLRRAVFGYLLGPGAGEAPGSPASRGVTP